MITGISLLLVTVSSGFRLSLVTVILGHSTALTAVATTEIFAGLAKLDRSLEEASADLGATRIQTLVRIVLPGLRTSLLGTALLIFTLSMDEIAVTFFLIGRENTLPLEIWSRLRRRGDPGNECHCYAYLFVFGDHHFSVTVADGPRKDGDNQPMSWTDKELGMDRRITRRDFMNGAAMAIAAAAAPHSFAQGATEAQDRPGYDPPAAHGLRGGHVGAFEVAHRLRDGTFWTTAGQPESTGAHYDLVVVGGGISGLASARFFHQAAGKSARVLILDNHDDFGGHAKRNEFQVDKTFMLGFGGTYSIESPAPYSPVAKGVIRDLGIDVSSYARHNDSALYPSLGLKQKIFFDKETFGADRLVINPEHGHGEKMWQEFCSQAPLTEKAKADLKRLYALDEDLMPGLSSAEKKAEAGPHELRRLLDQRGESGSPGGHPHGSVS